MLGPPPGLVCYWAGPIFSQVYVYLGIILFFFFFCGGRNHPSSFRHIPLHRAPSSDQARNGFHGRCRPRRRGLLPPRGRPLPAPAPLATGPSARSPPRLLHRRRSPQAQPQAAQVRRRAPVQGTFCLQRLLLFFISTQSRSPFAGFLPFWC
jgi:hypothetical protein